jgi:hypothetical protein
MSGNRIRYNEHPSRDNCKISLNSYTSLKTGAKYRILLDLNEMKFMIRNERDKELKFTSKQYKNLNVLKRTARKKLEDFGVSLGRESRDRMFGRCEKGYTQKQFEKEEKNK